MFELGILNLAIGGQLKIPSAVHDEIGRLVTSAEAAAARRDWAEVGTANLRFHAMLVSMHDSERISETFRRLMTELRLGFLAHEDPAAFHGPFLARNRNIYEQLTEGALAKARDEMVRYLDDAEADVLRAVRR